MEEPQPVKVEEFEQIEIESNRVITELIKKPLPEPQEAKQPEKKSGNRKKRYCKTN
ncbi:MAG: hypothetical protein R2883_00890 [Caldisericia bacterium]